MEVNLEFSTYPHRPLYGGGGRNPTTMSKSTLDHPDYVG